MLGRPDHGRRGSFDLERNASGAGRDLLEEVNDSKRLAPAKRERLAKAILAHAEAVSLVSIPASQIDRIGLGAANLDCLERALRALGERRSFDSWTATSRSALKRPARDDRPRRRDKRDHCGRLDRGQGDPRSPHGSPRRAPPRLRLPAP